MNELIEYILSAPGIACDSRKVVKGGVFFAIRGEESDGRDFITSALEKGASAIVIDSFSDLLLPEGIKLFQVEDTREALALASAKFHGEPARKLTTFGVTGTNGKSSVCWIVSELLSLAGQTCSQVGTLGWRDVYLGAGKAFTLIPTTTPDTVWLQGFCREAISRGVNSIAMEVSSHGLEQYRTSQMEWDVAAFTNLSRDHLDYHGSNEAYAAAKAKLFFRELAQSSKPSKAAVVNIDDSFGRELASRIEKELHEARLLCVGEGDEAELKLLSVSLNAKGTQIDLGYQGKRYTIFSQLVGRYNVENLLIATGMLLCSGLSLEQITSLIGDVPSVPGRLELVPAENITVLVDFAHTPDALVAAQEAVKEISPGSLITVFGCGGDRDRGKRPLMGQAVAQLSDMAIVTSDNPRTECAEQIIKDIVPGLSSGIGSKNFNWAAEVNRQKAIELALRKAKPGDVVLVAGRGHEPYQTVGTEKLPFLDAEICRQSIEKLGLS